MTIKKKKIILHVGTVKTGTSYLQHVMRRNAALFETLGLYYPTFGYLGDERNRDANGNILRSKKGVRYLERYISETPGEVFLLSEEGLFSDFKNTIPKFFQNYDVKIIAYVRAPVELIAAWSAEFAKPYNATLNGVADPADMINELVARYDFEMNGFLDSVDRVGAKHVIIRPFVTSSFVGGCLLTDFLTAIGIEPQNGVLDLVGDRGLTVNKTPDKKYCDVSKMIYDRLITADRLYLYNTNLVDMIYNLCGSGDDRTVIETLSPAEVATIHENLSWINGAINERYKNRSSFEKLSFDSYKYPKPLAYQPVDIREVELLLLSHIIRINIRSQVGEETDSIVAEPSFAYPEMVLDEIERALIELERRHESISNQRTELLRMKRLALPPADRGTTNVTMRRSKG